MAKKKIEDKIYNCLECTNSIYLHDKKELHCSTKIKDRDTPLTNTSRASEVANCSWYCRKGF